MRCGSVCGIRTALFCKAQNKMSSCDGAGEKGATIKRLPEIGNADERLLADHLLSTQSEIGDQWVLCRPNRKLRGA